MSNQKNDNLNSNGNLKRKRIIWFEHMYQPSWNFRPYTDKHGSWDPKKMIEKCYKPNALMMKRLGIKINMNITQTMFDFFRINNALDVLEIYKELARKGQIELVGSTAHHILTISKYRKVLPEEIAMQERFIKLFFGQSPKVFFPPEMAVDETTQDIVKSMGYKGLIVPGGEPNFSSWDVTGIFKGEIILFPHNNFLTGQFAFPIGGFTSDHDLNAVLEKIESYELPCMIAMDHETFGGYDNPHMLEMKERFFEIAKSKGWEFVHFSELLDEEPFGIIQNLKPNTWVGNFGKWEQMPDRVEAINKALQRINIENHFFIRKWILPSCHLHIDYATDLFWKYCKEAGVEI